MFNGVENYMAGEIAGTDHSHLGKIFNLSGSYDISVYTTITGVSCLSSNNITILQVQ